MNSDFLSRIPAMMDDFQEVSKPFFINTTMSFKDDKWPFTILACLNALRKQKQFHDVILFVDKHEIPAHRAVLACSSMYLSDMLRDPSVSVDENNVLQLPLEGVEANAAQKLVKFAYTGKLEIASENVWSVYHAANKWRMPSVKKACTDHLVENMNSKNCLELYKFAERESDKELLKIVEGYIKENTDEVAVSLQFHQLPRLQIEVISTLMNVNTSDRQIFESALDWIRRTVKSGTELSELLAKPQTLLITGSKTLKNLEEVDEVEEQLIEDYHLDPKKIGTFTPEKKFLNGHASLHILQPSPSYSNNSSTPRKLIMCPADLKVSHNGCSEEKWKIIGSTAMADFRFVALAELCGQLASIILYEKPGSPKMNKRPFQKRSLSIETENHHPPLAAMQHSRCAFGAAMIHGRLIVAGGYDKGMCHDTVELYDTELNRWTQLKKMEKPRGRFKFGVIEGQLFAAGGSDGHCELESCEMYDKERNTWSRCADMSTARSNFGADVLNGKLYVIGGNSGSVGLNSCEVFDPSKNTWSNIAPMIHGRSQVGVCSHDGKIYAVGGSYTWNCHNSVEVYDLESNEWYLTTPLNTPRRGAGVCSFKGKIYAVGGSDGQMVLSSVECFDPKTREWSLITNVSTPRMNASLTAVGNLMYALGGFDGKNFLDSLECYNEESNKWYTHARHLFKDKSRSHTPSPPDTPIEEKPVFLCEGSEKEVVAH